MTRNEFWTSLNVLCASPDRAVSMLRMTNLLQIACQEELPLLIACTRTPGRIHHSYTMFDAANPDLAGNRYLICFTGPEQARRSVAPSVDDTAEQDLTLEERFRLIDEEATSTPAEKDMSELSLEKRFRLIDEGSQPEKKAKPRRRRRKKATTAGTMWTTEGTSETATVSAKVVLDYMRNNRKVGGLIFDIYDGKRGVTLPKFMIEPPAAVMGSKNGRSTPVWATSPRAPRFPCIQ